MRHEPALVDRVPREAAAQVIVDPARRHLVERQPHHVDSAGC